MDGYPHQSKSSKNTVLLIILIILGIGLVAAVITVIGLAAGLGVERSKAVGPPLCTTRACVDLSSQILSAMNQSVDPCDDFYAFACSRFVEEAIIPFGGTGTSMLGSQRRRNVERIRTLMESGDDMGIEAIAKAIVFYQSCMQEDDLTTSVQTFQQFLQVSGGWSVLGVNTSTPWTLNNQEGILQEHLVGSQAFFNVFSLPDPMNSSRNLWTIIPGGLTLPSSSAYELDFVKQSIEQLMVSAFMLINPSETINYTAIANDILDFETEIASVYDFKGNLLQRILDNTSYTTYEELSSLFPQYNWRENLQYLGQLAGVRINQSNPLNNLATDFLTSLSSLLDQTSLTTQENYAKWHYLYALMPYMSEEFTDLYYLFQQKLFLVDPGSSKPQRYFTCVNHVESFMSFPVARAFTEVFLPPETRKNMSMIINELEGAMRERITSREWLDDATRQRALSKLRSVRELVAYPDEIFNNNYLNDAFSTLNVLPNASFLLNAAESIRFNSLKTIEQLDQSFVNNRSMWYFDLPPPTITNAVYSPLSNQIYAFEGILDAPVFTPDWPDYYNFGTVGYIVGHEYTHGFDNIGRQYDETGNANNWWTSASEAEFNSRAQCYINQYNRYSIPAGPVNGTFTLGENIADNGGLVAAYQAYKNRMEQTGMVELYLPGLPYNPDQLFFIGGAQLWCEVASDLTQLIRLSSDVHSPPPIRVLGTVSNSREFASAFNCPIIGSRMNPAEKCDLW